MQKPFIVPNKKYIERAFTADNFYANPEAVRQFALSQTFYTCADYIGSRSEGFIFDGVKESMEEIVGYQIVNLDNPENGVFEVYAGGDLSPITWEPRYDYTAYIFLNPDPPPESGITLQRHKSTKTLVGYKGLEFNPLDKFLFDRADVLGNIFNRIVILEGSILRNYSEYFGWDLGSGMLVQTFKFNVRK
jgi:hypothetical protein